jgi:copper transport protein
MRLVGLALALLLMLAGATPALSHASLITSEPSDGAILGEAPKHIALVYTEPVSPLVLKLIHSDGTVTPLDRYRLADNSVLIDVPADIGRGTLALSWRVISEDGHPIGGSIVFSVGAPSAGGIPVAPEADWPVRCLLWLTKVVVYVGLFIGVGGGFFGAFLSPLPPIATTVSRTTMVAGIAAAILSVGLQGLDAVQEPLSQIFRDSVWAVGFSTSFGTTAAIAVGALLAALAASAIPSATVQRVLALGAFLGVGLALAASGHASAASPQWLMRPSVFIHGVGIAFWAGALVPLGALLRSDSPDLVVALRRFSRAIPFALAALVAVGIVLAIVQVGRVEGLWTTNYGRLFLVKLALLGVLLSMAVINRWPLTSRAVGKDAAATRLLVRSISFEIVLVVAILGVAAGWRFTPPPRSLDAVAASSALIHIHEGPAEPASVHVHSQASGIQPASIRIESSKAMAHITVSPPQVGPATVSIEIFDGDFLPLDAKEVTLVLSNLAAGVEPIKRPATKSDDRPWRVDRVLLPVAGRWTVRIDILVSDFEMVKLESAIDVVP